jgi:hypothetical protein
MLHWRLVSLSRHGGMASGRVPDLSASAAVPAVVGLPHGLPRSLVFRVLVLIDLAAHKLTVVGPRVREDAEALSVFVREHNAKVEPVVFLAFAFDHGIRVVRLLLWLIFVRHEELPSIWLHSPAWAGAKDGAWRLLARSGSFSGNGGSMDTIRGEGRSSRKPARRTTHRLHTIS